MSTKEIIRLEVEESQLKAGDCVHCSSFQEAMDIIEELKKEGIESIYRSVHNNQKGDYVRILNVPEVKKEISDYERGRIDGASDLAKAILKGDETIHEVISNLIEISKMGGKSVWKD